MAKKRKNSKQNRYLSQIIKAPTYDKQQRDAPLSEWLSYAEQLQVNNNAHEAIKLLKHLSQVERGSLAQKKLLYLLVANSWFSDAKALLTQIDRSEDDIEITNIRAMVDLKLGQPKSAINYYSKALKLSPHSSQIAHSLSECYIALGDRERAEKWVRRALEKNRKLYPAYLTLAPLLNAEESASYIKQLKEHIHKDDLSETDKASVEFALAKLNQNCGNYIVEAELLHQANAKVNTFPIEQMEPALELQLRAITEYSQRLKDRLATQKHTSSPNVARPVLICSMPRSGSSLLESLLARSSQISPTGESSSLFAALRKLSEETAEPPGNLLQFSAVEDYREKLLDVHREILNLYQVDTPAYTDKSMINHLELGRFVHLYPDTRIVWLSRNPGDMAISCYQHLFEGGAGFDYIYSLPAIARQLQHFERCMTLWNEACPNSILRISYEKLAGDSHAELSKIFAFLKIEQPDKTGVVSGQNSVLTSSALQVRNKVNMASVNKSDRYPELAAEFDAANSA